MANNTVEIVYALPLAASQRLFTVDLGCEHSQTILEIINQSGILDYYPEIDLKVNKVGVYGEIKSLTDLVQPLDRIEIYRPLVIDPMAARRLRASKQKSQKPQKS